jgi:hypothetical protein
MSGIGSITRALALPAVLCGMLCAPSAEAAVNWGPIGSGAPAQAAAVGYKTETFVTSAGFTRQTVDMGLTQASGFKWYMCNLYGTVPKSSTTTLNADGSVTLAAFANNANCGMASITQIKTTPYFRGTAFGGGAYMEATLSFNPATINTATGWPAWWTMAVEHLNGDHGDQWVGQTAGYEHFAEPDIFEANLGPYGAAANTYNGAMEDWYGLWAKTCSTFCVVYSNWNDSVKTVPVGTNFTQYHRYGLLWVPATAAKQGTLTYYFDGVQVGLVRKYSQYTTQAPVPTTKTPWTFGVVDKDHLVLILGTGASTPMKVQSIQVWQASAANNLHN